MALPDPHPSADPSVQRNFRNLDKRFPVHAKDLHSEVRPQHNVKWYGATGDGVTDDTDAFEAAAAAVISAGGGEVLVPPGNYLLTSEIDFGDGLPITLRGMGSSGQDTSVGRGASRLIIDHSGWGVTWAQGSGSARFRGFTMEDLHIEQKSGAGADGGIHLGNASNCHLSRITVSDFTGSTGIKIGDSSTSGSQYSVLEGVTVSDCQIGIDLVDSNGVRLIGCFLESDVTTPPASSIGVKVQSGSDTATLIGTVIQGFDTLLQIAAENSSVIACRFEGWETVAVEITDTGDRASVIGGSFNNSINGSVGTGITVASGAADCQILVPEFLGMATKISDSSTTTRIIAGSGMAGKLPILFDLLKAQEMTINKTGAGAQRPVLQLQSNATAGPQFEGDVNFTRMLLNHTWANATEFAVQLRSTDMFRIGYNGTTITHGFYGGSPVAKPTVTGSRGGNAALASLLTALASQGLITDSTT